MNVLDLLKEDGFRPKRVASTNGGEYASACPFCGGKDRFRIWPNREVGGFFWCRHCGRSGNSVKYLLLVRGMEPEKILPFEKEIQSQRELKTSEKYPLAPLELASNKEWEQRAKEVIDSAEEYLWRDCCVNIRSWLIEERGLNEATIKKARLGWTPQDVFMAREEWGLAPEKKDDGKDLKVLIPHGLVIPSINEGHIQRVRVRRENSENGNRYYLIPRSSTLSMVLGYGTSIVVVESELDGILLEQEAGGLIGVIALGSVVIKPDPETTSLLDKAKRILVALDSDEAGARTSWEWWLKRFPQAKRWPIPSRFGKDPTEARMNGLNLRNWVLAGLNSREGSLTFQLFANFDSEAKNGEKFEKLKSSKTLGISIDSSNGHGSGLINLSAPGHFCVSFPLDQHKSNGHLGKLKVLLECHSEKIFYDAKPAIKLFNDLGLKVMGPVFDLKLADQILMAGVQGEADPSLKSLVSKYAGDQDHNNGSPLIAMKEVLERRLNENGLTWVANLEFECIEAVAGMESNGIFLNIGAVKKAIERFTLIKVQTESILYNWLGDTNLNSQPQLIEALEKKGINPANTKEVTLLKFAKDQPQIKALLVYKKTSYLLNLAESLLTHNPSTGRIHAHYNQIGASTGRFSCVDPNMQAIPRYRQVRSWFVAPPGFRLVIGDYSQIELRVAAEITRDERMIEAYRNGEDLHRLTASLISEKPIDSVTKQDRQAAKAVNFGLIYAMGAQGLCEYAKEAFGVTLSEEQAIYFRQKFFEAYAGIAAWHKETQEKMPTETRTILGRRRLWNNMPKITELLNSPVQGTSADIIKKALCMLLYTLQGTRAMIVGCIHDEILLEAPIEATDEVALILKETMEEAGRFLLKTVPVEAQVVIVDSWAEE
jgi:DNA polymerase I-like protein with 3'-5' exonuclease and polymerase domains